MEDTFGRTITYLRLSVTDLCNYRCRYCMAPEGVEKTAHDAVCSLEELRDMTAAAVACGVRKVRITGGEPLVRRGIVDLCRMVKEIPRCQGTVPDDQWEPAGVPGPAAAGGGGGPAEHQPGYPAAGPVPDHHPFGGTVPGVGGH